MILVDIKNYIKERKLINLKELSFHFQRDPDTMREMLAHWIRKGIIRKSEKPPSCGTKCMQCKPAVAEIYCWCEVF